MPNDYDLTPENIERWLAKLKGGPIGSNYKDPFKPQNLTEYIGQEKAKKIVSIIVKAARKDQRPIPNTLITGPFGQGKTSLARIMADMYEPNISLVDAASVNKTPLTKGTYIIDEIHNLGSDICDSLNILLDNGNLHIIGCSTNAGALPAAFRSRFRQIYLEPYTDHEIAGIINRVLHEKAIRIDNKLLNEVAKRSRKNPRVALNYLSFILDITTLQNKREITKAIIEEAFNELGVDKNGFLTRDYAYLEALPKDGRPVGLQYLSAITSIDPQTIESEIEPYLLQNGLIDRTPKGRKLVRV